MHAGILEKSPTSPSKPRQMADEHATSACEERSLLSLPLSFEAAQKTPPTFADPFTTHNTKNPLLYLLAAAPNLH